MKKNLKIITIVALALILCAAFYFGYTYKKCPVIEPPGTYKPDTAYIDSLQKVGSLRHDSIEKLKEIITIYRKQYVQNKKPIEVRIDSINNDSIPDVFRHLASYYSKQ